MGSPPAISTPLNVPSLVRPMAETHASRKNQKLEWRLQQLRSLQAMLTDHGDDFVAALGKDLEKDPIQAAYTELMIVRNEIDYVTSKLGGWMSVERVPSLVFLAPCFSEVRRVPLLSPGVLVIGPSNYPLSLSLLPAVGSLAGGNPTVIKPSELCKNVSNLMARVLPNYFHDGVLQVVEGGPEVTTALLKEKWGLIFFTGSERIGKIVNRAAAETMTPVVLELGGKTPVFISQDCPDDMRVIANRVAWAKTINCGQSCIAPDYVVCHKDHVEHFCDEMVNSLERMFGKNPQKSELSRILSSSHATRHVDLISDAEKSGASIICGGSGLCDVKDRYIAPTIILDPPRSCRVMNEEVFGPILSVLTVTSTDHAIEEINRTPGTPLNLCVFTKSAKLFDQIISACPAAGFHRNDSIVLNASSVMPFGGLGSSGYGTYHGRHSFNTFTHLLPVFYKPCQQAFEFGGLRYHPYKGSKLTLRALGAPYMIPVLHKQKWSLFIGAFMLLMYFRALQPVSESMLNILADALEALADQLRSG